jgi:iron complex transport system substrate-binding protein
MNPDFRARNFVFSAAIAATILLGFRCGHPNSELIEKAPLISHNFHDGFNRLVVVKEPPKRVISLASNITEIIYAIGGQKRLIAVSHDSNYPPAADKLDYVQTYPDFDLPAVAEYMPDLILASTEIHDLQIAPFFDRVKMNLYFQNYQSLEDIFKEIKATGEMLGCETAANYLADSLAKQTQTIAEGTAGQVKYNTAIILGINPLTVVGPKSFMNDLLVKAGGKNAFANLPERYPTVTAEQFIQAAPEYVLIPTNNDKAWNELVALHPEIFNNIPATTQNHIFQMEPEIIVRPGPRIVEGLAYLTRILHPRVDQ